MKQDTSEKSFTDSIKQTVLEWISKAENDYQACQILSKADNSLPDIISFHCQQTVEKYLKAILVLQSKRVKKIHDLDVLLKECVVHHPNLANIQDDLIFLDSYGPEVRYPGPVDIKVEEIPEILKKMETVRSAVRDYFTKEGIL